MERSPCSTDRQKRPTIIAEAVIRQDYPESKDETMLHFEGDRDFALPPGQLWPKLRDARFLVLCIPDASVEGTPERDRAVCTVRPGFAFVRGTLETIIEVPAAVEPSTVQLSLKSKGIGSSSEVEAHLSLTPHETGTRVHWTADIKQLGGLLKAVPSGLIRGAAQKVIADVWAGIEANLKKS
jgi:carbon monoxide dehydrogenase subunit G